MSRLTPVQSTSLKVITSELQFKDENLQKLAELLSYCEKIVHQHCDIWFSTKPSEITKRLIKANSFIVSLKVLLCLIEENDFKKNIHFYLSSYEESYQEIICSIPLFQKDHRKVIINQRNELKTNICLFFEKLAQILKISCDSYILKLNNVLID